MFNAEGQEPHARAGVENADRAGGCLIGEVLLKKRLRILDEFPSLGPVPIQDSQLVSALLAVAS